MTGPEICDKLDEKLGPIIERLREENPGINHIAFSGAITGYLLKTGVALAVKGGCPKKALMESMQDIIEAGYRK